MTGLCYNCTERKLGCHSKCSPYKDFKDERKQILELKNKANMVDEVFYDLLKVKKLAVGREARKTRKW